MARHGQTWLAATKCSYACMAGAFVSNLWGCQSQITKIHVFVNKIIFKWCVLRDHKMLSLLLLLGSISVTDWLQQTIWGDINQSQTRAQQTPHDLVKWTGSYIYMYILGDW